MADEYQDLVQRYSSMTHDELIALAAVRSSLTDVARLALHAELRKRGIDLDRPSDISEHRMEYRPLVTVGQFRDLPAAWIAKASLESAGIDCFLGDENIIRMDWFYSNLIGGVKLRVPEEDADAARAILAAPQPESFDVEGVGSFERPKCPQCGSVEIMFAGINKPLSYGSMCIGVPIPFASQLWRCDACSHQWEEQDDAEDARLS